MQPHPGRRASLHDRSRPDDDLYQLELTWSFELLVGLLPFACALGVIKPGLGRGRSITRERVRIVATRHTFSRCPPRLLRVDTRGVLLSEREFEFLDEAIQVLRHRLDEKHILFAGLHPTRIARQLLTVANE